MLLYTEAPIKTEYIDDRIFMYPQTILMKNRIAIPSNPAVPPENPRADNSSPPSPKSARRIWGGKGGGGGIGWDGNFQN
jgi:hypothetical protein